MPDSDTTPITRSARFIIGFLIGGASGVCGSLMSEPHLVSALGSGLFGALLIGSIGALFGKRVFDFLVELFTRFP
jgi:hypothetical protein